MNRSLVATRRVLAQVPAAMRPMAKVQARPMSASSHDDHGHDDHHAHTVFDLPFNPYGTPLFILGTVVIGGLGTIWFAVAWTQSGWNKK